MTNVHKKLEQFQQWIDIDVNDSPVRNTLRNKINADMEKNSPQILKDLKEYSPYRQHLGKLGNTSLDCLKADNTLATHANVVLAAVKFKKLLKNKNGNLK